MIDIRQTALVEVDYTEPFEDRVDILFRELELATKWQCPSLLLAIYSSEFVHGDAELALENRLLDLGQKAHHIVVKSQEDADIPLLISELNDLKNVVVFVDGLQWGCGQADYNAYRCLDKHREFFIENRIRVVFWLTETEAIHLAHYAPDYWTFRHRVIEFVDSPRPEQIQPQLSAACPVPDNLTEDSSEDLDAKITLRAALLTDLPEGAESTAARANLLLTLGILHWRRGDYDQATQFLNTAMELAAKLQDNRFEALCFNANALVAAALGKNEEAILAYQRAVELAPENVSPWNNLGNLHSKLEQFEEAAAAYQKAVEQNPADPLSWAGLGEAHSKLGRHEEAIFAYRKNLELDPENSHTWIGLGDVYAAEGQWDDTLAAYQKGLAIEPSNARVWNELGALHYNAAAHDEALSDYARAIELGLHSPQAYSQQADIHIRRSEYKEAVPLLLKSLELQAEAAQAAPLWNQLGDVYRKLNDYDAAVAAYRKADELASETEPTQQMSASVPEDEPTQETSSRAPIEAEVPQAPAVEPVAETVVEPEAAPVLEPVEPAVSVVQEALASQPAGSPEEILAEASRLVDDSGTMANESDQDFSKWLESLASRVPMPSLSESSPNPPEQNDNSEVPEISEASEASDKSDGTDLSDMSEAVDTADDPAEILTFTPDAFDLYGPQAFTQELETITEAPAAAETPSPVEDAQDIPPASPDVRARLEAMRASTPAIQAAAPLPEPQERTQPLENQISSDLESSSTPALAADPLLETARSQTSGSQPSADPAAPAAASGASSTQADIDARSAQIWNELGNIYYNIVAYDEAINALNKAIELDHSYGWTYNNLASIYIHKGSYAEAIPLLQKGIPLLKASKEKAMLWNRLGDAYRHLEQPEKAAEAYQKAVELDPDNVSLLTRARFSLLGNCRA